MSENEEILYAAYIMLLKHGLELPNSFMVKLWGLSVKVKEDRQQDFFKRYFKGSLNLHRSDTLKCSILVIGRDQQYQYKKKKAAFWKIVSGRVVARHADIRSSMLLPGDEVTAASKGYILHNLDSPSVVLQLEIN